MEYSLEEIDNARRIIAAVEADKRVKAEAARRKKEEETQKAVAEAAELVQQIRDNFERLKVLSKGRDLHLSLFDIYELAQELDTETDWDSSSLYC